MLAAIIVVAAILRAPGFGSLDLWLDEGITAQVVRLSWPTVLGLHGPYEAHPPLYFVATKLATIVLPEVYAGRAVSLVTGILTIPALYLLGQRLMGARPALVACAVLAISPLHIWYSREGRMYALSGLLVTSAYLALVAFYQSPRRRTAVAYGLAIALAMYANYGAFYSLAPQAILLVMLARKHGRRSAPVGVAIVGAALAFVPWLPSLLRTTSSLGGSREYYLGVSAAKITASIAAIVGVGGQGSYFWGTHQTPWERWPALQVIFLVAVGTVLLGGIIALRRRPLPGAVVIGLLPGTVLVAGIVSLASPGYADRTVLAAVVGWSLVVGSLAIVPLPTWPRTAGWAGAAVIGLTGALTLAAMYVGSDKQHWRTLASDSKSVTGFGFPVWAYPTPSGTLVDIYEPSVFSMAGADGDRGDNYVIADGADAPSSTPAALWLVYIEAPGVDRIREQLVERGYRRAMHKYYWNPMYLDLYVAQEGSVGHDIPVNWRNAEYVPGEPLVLGGPLARTIAGSAVARGGQLYVLTLEARRASPDGQLSVAISCAAGARTVEFSTSEQTQTSQGGDAWHRATAAVWCPPETDQVQIDISDSGGEVTVRGLALREVSRTSR